MTDKPITPEPSTVPASKTLLIALRQQVAIHERAMNEIVAAAVEDNPALAKGTLNLDRGIWTLPD